MSSDPLEDKASRPAQPSVAPRTESFPAITPSTTSTADEKNNPVSIELRSTSSVTPPATAHHGTPYDTDIEAMTTQRSSDRLNRRSTANDPNCTVWPGQDHWKRKARAAKINNRSCQPFARLNKRTRIAIKITIILLVVAVAIGVGFGVSKPLGAGIWQPHS